MPSNVNANTRTDTRGTRVTPITDTSTSGSKKTGGNVQGVDASTKPVVEGVRPAEATEAETTTTQQPSSRAQAFINAQQSQQHIDNPQSVAITSARGMVQTTIPSSVTKGSVSKQVMPATTMPAVEQVAEASKSAKGESALAASDLTPSVTSESDVTTAGPMVFDDSIDIPLSAAEVSGQDDSYDLPRDRDDVASSNPNVTYSTDRVDQSNANYASSMPNDALSADEVRERQLVNAAEVGKRQRESLQFERDLGEKMERLLGRSRYKSPGEIMDAQREITEEYGFNRQYDDLTYRGDEALRWTKTIKGRSDKDLIDSFRMVTERTNEANQGEQSPETSIDAQNQNGNVPYDPNSTVSDNVQKAEVSARSSAQIITNPYMIKVEGMTVERQPSRDGDKRYEEYRVRYSNVKGKDIDGAVGLVRNTYHCSYSSVLSLVFARLGLGVDGNGKICGKSVQDFELPAEVFIEACVDIARSQEDYGLPLTIVDGRPGGLTGKSRDDTGMFPVLGGTRCYPLGYIPISVFEDLAFDPESPLHDISEREFYKACAETWLNETQPRIMANTTGPRGWQAAALMRAMEGVLGIDGVSLDMFNIPEYQTFRTANIIRADIADSGDEAMEEANNAKLRYSYEVMDRWSRENFKDGGQKADNEYAQPGEKRRGIGDVPIVGTMDDFIGWYTSTTRAARALHVGTMLTAPFEGLVSSAEQQAVISAQNVRKRHIEKKWHMGDRFDKSDFISNAMDSEDALEAIEVAQALMRIGGRTALDAFRFDENDEGTGRRYAYMTKANMIDFLERWGQRQPPEVMQKISQFTSDLTSFAMFGEGMARKWHSQQFADMALYESLQATVHGAAALDAKMLEEIGHAGELRGGAGEAIVHALLDTDAGYEAFKTMGATSIARTSPITRATQIVMRQNGVTELLLRSRLGWFFEYKVGKLMRAIPMSNTISYTLSYMTKTGMLKANEDMEMANAFARGYDKVTQKVARISDYQIGMDSADFFSGLYKNMAYDMVTFGGNYIIGGAINYALIALMGGLRRPDDDRLMTQPSEWIIEKLGVPIKLAWWMDDLMGCGMPLAYALAIAQGWDEYDEDGNVIGHVDAGSEKALDIASSAFFNSVSSFNSGELVIDAIDFATNFNQNVNEMFDKGIDGIGQDIRQGIKDFDPFAGIDAEMQDYYGDDASKMSEQELRQEWINSRIEGIVWNMFGNLTPAILSEILPGTRDSLWGGDKYVHTTSKKYDPDYDRETAENEWRVSNVTYSQHQRMNHTQDHVISAYIADFLNARDGVNYMYEDMPIDTTQDPRNLAEDSFQNRWGLNLELPNGTKNLDITGPEGKPDGKTDSKEERQKYLFDVAEDICKYINDTYILTDGYPEKAVIDGLYIPADARRAAINYCYYMIGSKNRTGKLWKDFDDEMAALKEQGIYLPDDEYYAKRDEVKAEIQKYSTILYDYLNNRDVPWRAPRYAHLKSDTEYMYVDAEGNPLNVFDKEAQAVPYDYGGTAGLSPIAMPNDTGLHNFNSPTWDTFYDSDGNIISDMERIYDQAAAAGDITMGRWAPNNVLEQMASGQGMHNTEREEDLAIERGGNMSVGVRSWESFDGTYPDWLSDLDEMSGYMDSTLGIDNYLPNHETTPDKDSDDSSDEDSDEGKTSNNGGNRSYSSGGGRRSYSYSYGGGGGGYSAYNPKIYSNSRQVYSQRASGMSTRQPYRATSTYLRPAFYTSGSRNPYRRQN